MTHDETTKLIGGLTGRPWYLGNVEVAEEDYIVTLVSSDESGVELEALLEWLREYEIPVEAVLVKAGFFGQDDDAMSVMLQVS